MHKIAFKQPNKKTEILKCYYSHIPFTLMTPESFYIWNRGVEGFEALCTKKNKCFTTLADMFCLFTFRVLLKRFPCIHNATIERKRIALSQVAQNGFNCDTSIIYQQWWHINIIKEVFISSKIHNSRKLYDFTWLLCSNKNILSTHSHNQIKLSALT